MFSPRSHHNDDNPLQFTGGGQCGGSHCSLVRNVIGRSKMYTCLWIRVSKSCNHEITWLHKIFENLSRYSNNERKPGNLAVIVCIPHNLTKFLFLVSHVLCHFYHMFLCKNFKQSNLIVKDNLLLKSLFVMFFLL